jgi:hypothetical protein
MRRGHRNRHPAFPRELLARDAQKMLSMGLGTREQIADITGLPLEEVKKLAAAGTEPVLA